MRHSQNNNSIALCIILLMSIMFATVSCTTVKPYQRAYLNDAEMQAGKLDIEKFDENMQTYREGASGGGTGKSSGGCGCN
jgi:hypothetical protein